MIEVKPQLWKSPQAARFAQTLSSINDAAAMQSFLRDVMTESEIIEMSSRFEAARLLAAGTTYTEITKATKLSSRTIARISEWMQNGAGGYTSALNIANHHASFTRSGEA